MGSKADKDSEEVSGNASLDDFLDDQSGGDEAEEAEESAPEAEEPEAAEEGEEKAASPAAPKKTVDEDIWADPAGENIPRHVHVATRKKWRERTEAAERKAAELEARLSAVPQRHEPPVAAAPQAPKEEVDPDDEVYSLGLGKSFVKVRKDAAEVARDNAIEAERRVMRRVVPDYTKAEEAFLAAARSNRALVAGFHDSEDQVGYVLNEGRKLLKRKEYGIADSDDLEAIEAKVRAKLEAEKTEPASEEAEAEPKPPARKPAPKSLAGHRNAGTKEAPAGDDEDILDEVFPRR